MAMLSMFSFFLTFGNIVTLLSGNFQLNNRLKRNTIACNKTYDDNDDFKMQLRFKRDDNSLYNTIKLTPEKSIFTNRRIHEEDGDTVTTARVLDVSDGHRVNSMPPECFRINSQKKLRKGTGVYNWKREVHCQPRSRIMQPTKKEKLRYKREIGVVSRDQNYAINNKHSWHRPKTRLLSNRQKDTKTNKLMKGAMHINTIREKRVEIEQESIEPRWNALEESIRFYNINGTLNPTSGLTVLHPLPVVTPLSYSPDPISKRNSQRHIDIVHNSQPNGQLDNVNHYPTLNYISNLTISAGAKQIMRDKISVMKLSDDIQTEVYRTMNHKLHTQTFRQTIQTNFYDSDILNNNISLRNINNPYVPSETLNQTLTQPKRKIPTQKKFKSKKNRKTMLHTKAGHSKVLATQSKRPGQSKNIRNTEKAKQFRISRKNKNNISTSAASNRRAPHFRNKEKSKKTVRALKSSKHRLDMKETTRYVDEHGVSFQHFRKMKWSKENSKKKKFNQALSTKKVKQPTNKKHNKGDGKKGKGLKKSHQHINDKKTKTTISLFRLLTEFYARMGVSEKDVVKPLKLTHRNIEVMGRNGTTTSPPYTIGGTFNSYYNFWNNNNNHYYYYSSGMTDRNVVNNLIVIDFDTSPPTTTTLKTTTSNITTTHGKTICMDGAPPTVFFIKKKVVKDYSIIIAAFVLIALSLIICCCCCCAPIIIMRRKNKKCCPS